MIKNIFHKIEKSTFLSNNKTFFFLIAVILLSLTIIMPDTIHDYRFYVAQWKIIRDGLNPYIGTNNAYGLIYNLFAYTDVSKTIAIPKLLFISTYLLAAYLIWQKAVEKNIKSSNLILLLVLFNPLVWLFSTVYGSNDGFLSGITSMAILFLLRDKNYIAGFLLAIAVGFKFTPILITPFLFINHKSINYKAGIAFILTLTTTYYIGYYHLGISIFKPFLFGSSRESVVLSIFRFIRGELQPLSFLNITNLDNYSTYLVLLSCFICFGMYYFLKIEKTISAFLCYSYVLLFYKVGNHQFYYFLLLLGIIALIQNEQTLLKRTNIITAFIVFFGFFFLCVAFYGVTGGHGGKFYVIREYIGFPLFLTHISANYILTKELLST